MFAAFQSYLHVRIHRSVACSKALMVAAVFSLSSCLIASPVEETKAFSNAAEAVSDAGAILFDSLAVAERQRHDAIFKKSIADKYTFKVADAAYFATIGEPPNTATFRHSLNVVTAYANLLVSLAEAKDVASTKSHMVEISSSIGAIAGLAGVEAAVGALSPIIDHALRASSIAEARRLVLEGAPLIEALLAALKNATPEIFNALIYFDRQEPLPNQEQAANLAIQRTKVANFVILLDRLAATFRLLVQGIEHPYGRLTLSELATETALLRADVEAARKFMVGR